MNSICFVFLNDVFRRRQSQDQFVLYSSSSSVQASTYSICHSTHTGDGRNRIELDRQALTRWFPSVTVNMRRSFKWLITCSPLLTRVSLSVSCAVISPTSFVSSTALPLIQPLSSWHLLSPFTCLLFSASHCPDTHHLWLTISECSSAELTVNISHLTPICFSCRHPAVRSAAVPVRLLVVSGRPPQHQSFRQPDFSWFCTSWSPALALHLWTRSGSLQFSTHIFTVSHKSLLVNRCGFA